MKNSQIIQKLMDRHDLTKQDAQEKTDDYKKKIIEFVDDCQFGEAISYIQMLQSAIR